MTTVLKTPIAYYGGKQRIASKIVKLFPPHSSYAEPFCGGAAVLFAKGYPEVCCQSDYREVINDLNSEIVNFFRVLQNPEKSAQLRQWLELTPYAREEHAKAGQIYKNPADHTDVERAWALFIQSNCSFAKTIGKGWAFSKLAQNDALTFNNKIARLQLQAERLKMCHIDNMDAIAFIKRWDSPTTFFYCDPPYPGTEQGHYKGYTPAHFAELVETLKGIQGKFALSNYPQPGIPDDWHLVEIEATMSARKNVREKRVECVWTNYHPPGVASGEEAGFVQQALLG